jgi:Glycosyl transferase family 2
MSRVDVVVPCYNYGRYLERCLASLLDEQSGVSVRALVIDDCSTDDSPDVARRLAERDSRIEFRRHGVNHGHIATYNEGLLGWAEADYCLLISADDLLVPDALTRAVAVLDRHSDVGLCYGRQVVFSGAVPETIASNRAATSLTSGREFWESSCRIGQNVVPTPTAVVRTRVQREVGGYRKELPHTGDLEMWLRIAARTNVAAIDADQAFKRMHGENMQVQFVSSRLTELQQRLLAFESAFADCRGRIENASELERNVREALASEALWAASEAFDGGDVEGCRRAQQVAAAVSADVRGRSEWRRLEIKRRLGPRLWHVLRPFVGRQQRQPAER